MIHYSNIILMKLSFKDKERVIRVDKRKTFFSKDFLIQALNELLNSSFFLIFYLGKIPYFGYHSARHAAWREDWQCGAILASQAGSRTLADALQLGRNGCHAQGGLVLSKGY